MACKPGSVWPRSPKATERGSHSSGTALARSLLQPTRMTGPETGWTLARPRHPYSVLLPVGFAVPSMSPCPRWALTPPFHPYSAKRSGLLSVALSLRSPSPDVIRHRISVEPGLSSPRGLSALAESGCPANWQALLNASPRPAPEKTAVFFKLPTGQFGRDRVDAAAPSERRPRSRRRIRAHRSGHFAQGQRRACRSRRSFLPPGRCRQ